MQLEQTSKKYPNKGHWKGRRHSPESIQKMKGHSSWNKGLKMPLEYRDRLSELKKGDKHPNWKGGVSPINKRARMSIEYRVWRESVFMRDDYTCKACGARNGNGFNIYLEAHHLKPFCDFIELRYVVGNGITLCRKCHELTSNYRGKGRKKKTV